jgi:pimeloyl-ACP methyl ester carboxylesterase
MKSVSRRTLVATLPWAIPVLASPIRSLMAAPLAPPTVQRKVKFIHTGFGDIAYTEKGRGNAALFVHGAFLNGYQWRHVIDRVAGLRRSIAIDLMGHGFTKISVDQDLSFNTQAEMLEAVCAALDLAQVDLVANDSGGGIAQIFAARHPERIRTLTLTNCDTYDNWPGDGAKWMMAASAAQFEGVVQRWVADLSHARATFAPAYEHPELVSDETFRTYLLPLARTSESIHNLHRFFLAFDNHHTMAIVPLLKQLQAPTQIVWGTGDAFFDTKWAAWLRETIPGTRKLIELQKAHLFFPEERPAELADALADHWRETADA